jgi:hypothetical protein
VHEAAACRSPLDHFSYGATANKSLPNAHGKRSEKLFFGNLVLLRCAR